MTQIDLEARRRGLGGSDIAPILGLSPWKSAYQVWLEKTGQANGEEENSAMAYGNLVEPVIRQWYEGATGYRVSVPDRILTHVAHEFMLANLDGMTGDRVVEIKTARSNTDWGEPGTDGIPVYYMTQVQWYMMIAGFELADVVVSFAGTMPVIYTVEADAEIQDALTARASDFWSMVQQRIAPPPVTLQDMLLAFPKSKGVSVVASAEIEPLVADLKALNAGYASIDDQVERIKSIIMAEMKDADTLTDLAGKPLVTWKTAKASQSFDSRRFKAEHPMLWSQYAKEGKPSRRFLIK